MATSVLDQIPEHTSVLYHSLAIQKSAATRRN
jgi:hypothetical protein